MVLIKNKLSIKHKRQTKLKVNPKKRKEAVATKAFSSGTIEAAIIYSSHIYPLLI